jgi:type IV pilus assembly protein PilC
MLNFENPPASEAPVVTIASPSPNLSFSYQAQTDDGQRLSGVIDAPDADTALQRLQMLRLRVVELEPAKQPRSTRPIRGDAFVAFNQQLAQLTKAGMPVERGLRLIAADMRRGRLSRTIAEVAAELESGIPLGQAFEKHRRQFPTLYGQLLDAGVRSGNLPGILLTLGRHLETEQRLRGMLWRTFSYPAMVLTGLVLVLLFVGAQVLPQFKPMYEEFHLALPAITQILLYAARATPYLLVVFVALLVGLPILWAILRVAGQDRAAMDWLVLPLPLVGPVIKLSLVARWLDALKIGVDAGLDLPASITLASDVVGSPFIRRDGKAMIAALEAGQSLVPVEMRLIPTTVPAAMEFAAGHNDLPTTLGTLSEMYQRQAELRLESVPTILTPLLVILIALLVGFVVGGLFAPLLSLIQGISGK